MANSKFDAKSFNPEAFKYMVGRVPNLTLNALKKSRALAGNPDIRAVFTSQNGTGYARLAMRGLLDGDAVNYDGETDITATSTKTFEQGMVVVGRAKAWTEKDFSYDITGGVDFMGNVSAQVAEYKDTLDQKTLLSILKGVFAMPTTDAKNKEFVEKHSTTIYAPMSATTLNSAVNKACGANKQKFSLVFMHSDVATNLENMKLLEFMKQTDGDGIQKDLTLATWNGRTVVVDDDLPAVTGYADAEADTPGALVIKASGASGASEIDLAKATPYFGTRTLAADMYVVPATQYTTFIMGNGAISYEDIGAKVPYEMAVTPRPTAVLIPCICVSARCSAPMVSAMRRKVRPSCPPRTRTWRMGRTGRWFTAGKALLPSAPISTTRPFPLPGFSLWADGMAVIPVA